MCRISIRSLVVCCAGPLGLAGAALGQGTITQLDSIFAQGAAPASNAGIGGGPANFRVFGAASPDHLVQTWWWYGFQNRNREFCLANTIGQGWAGNAGFQDFDLVDGADHWRVRTTYTVIDTGANQGRLYMTFSAQNISGSSRSIWIFHYANIDVNATPAADAAVLTVPNQVMTLGDGPTFMEYRGVGAMAYQAGTAPTVRTILSNAAPNTLANVGCPYAGGDYEGAYQWQFLLVPNFSTVTATAIIAVNTHATPLAPPVGACSMPAGFTPACQIMTAADCLEAGGQYRGDGTDCNPCPCDWNHDGRVNSQDYFDFLQAFFAGQADVNGDGTTNSQDYFDFLRCFFAPPNGC